MGVDLRSKHGGMSLTWSNWRYCLELAQTFGWQPAGTAGPDPRYVEEIHGFPVGALSPVENWSGTYFSNDFQRVTDEDASNLAAALDRAHAAREKLKNCLPFTSEQADELIGDFRCLKDLANFAAAGGFYIR